MDLPIQSLIQNTSTPTFRVRQAPPARSLLPEKGFSAPASGTSLSSLAAFSIKNQLTELSFSADKTDMLYRKDDSLLLKASSHFDFTLKQETTQIDLTITADQLGLTKEDFAALGGKPIEIRFSFNQLNAQIEFRSETNVVKKNRTLDEILRDLTHALTDIFKNRGDKSIAMLMDEEAFAILGSDPKIAGLLDEIFALIEVINNMKMYEGERDLYAIILSGKGKPYIDHQESTRINIENRVENFNMTILPPAEEALISAESASEAPAEEQEATP